MTWTPRQIQSLRDLYPNRKAKDITCHLGKTLSQVYHKAHELGLKKNPLFLISAESGRIVKGSGKGSENRFKKGHIPWCKGKKGMCTGGKQTQFAPGSTPHNISRDGEIRVRNCNGRKIPFIRISRMKWKLLSRHLYELHYGEIPPGMVVRFRDGNIYNHTKENLEIISRAENLNRNSIYRYPEELIDTMRTLGTLKRQINKYAKQ